jgi:uncharacterized protein
MQDTITQEKLLEYFELTSKALKLLRLAPPEGTHLHKAALDFQDMAMRYFNDAGHFKEKGNYVLAFGALNYAHGWLDAGARLGLFDVNHNSDLFTVD